MGDLLSFGTKARKIGLADAIILGVFLVLPVSAENLYVRPDGGTYGTENGSSWANAFRGFGDVVWGSGAGQLGAGDTLYVGAGTYSTAFTAGGSGTSASRIYIRAAQDTQTGTAVFSATDMSAKQYITMDGSYNGATNFVFNGGIAGQSANFCHWQYFYMTNNVIDLRYSGANVVGYFTACLTTSAEETTMYGIASDNNGYDQTIIHHGHVIVIGQIDNGNGPDGMHAGDGFTFTNMIFQAVVGSYTGSQHQDLIQCYGIRYLKVINCEFIDSGDSQLDLSKSGNATFNNMQIYNNIFRRTINNMGTVMLRLYVDSGGVISALTDIRIDNNTFVDGARTSSSYGAAIRLQAGAGSTSATSCSIQNNIIYNCGDGWPAVLIENYTDNWAFGNNLINAGSEGNASTSGWTQNNGQSAAPRFVSYSPYAMGNDLHLASADTVAKDRGISLSSVFNKDREGDARPQGSAWDIGADEFGSAGPSTNPVVAISSGALDFGSIAVGTSAELILTVQNVGAGTLAGTATVPAPFSIVSGGTYSLGNNQSQVVTVRFSPAVAGSSSQTVTFTGGGGAIASVIGSAWAILSGLSFDSTAGIITDPFVADSGGFIYQSSDTGVSAGGRAVYAFAITNAGSYVIVANVNAPGDAANSFFVNIDAEPTDPAMIWDISPFTSGFENRPVSWRGNGTFDTPQFPNKAFALSVGTHQLIVRGREAVVQLGSINISSSGGSGSSVTPPSNLRVIGP